MVVIELFDETCEQADSHILGCCPASKFSLIGPKAASLEQYQALSKPL